LGKGVEGNTLQGHEGNNLGLKGGGINPLLRRNENLFIGAKSGRKIVSGDKKNGGGIEGGRIA